MSTKSPPLIFIAIAAYAFINSLTLFETWGNTPIEKFSWVPFVIWLSPICIYFLKKPPKTGNFPIGNTLLASTGLAAVLFSNLGSLNAAAYIGFALSCASLLPWSAKNTLWLISAISWMPVFGWLLLNFISPQHSFLFPLGRIFLSMLGFRSLYQTYSNKNP